MVPPEDLVEAHITLMDKVHVTLLPLLGLFYYGLIIRTSLFLNFGILGPFLLPWTSPWWFQRGWRTSDWCYEGALQVVSPYCRYWQNRATSSVLLQVTRQSALPHAFLMTHTIKVYLSINGRIGHLLEISHSFQFDLPMHLGSLDLGKSFPCLFLKNV